MQTAGITGWEDISLLAKSGRQYESKGEENSINGSCSNRLDCELCLLWHYFYVKRFGSLSFLEWRPFLERPAASALPSRILTPLHSSHPGSSAVAGLLAFPSLTFT